MPQHLSDRRSGPLAVLAALALVACGGGVGTDRGGVEALGGESAPASAAQLTRIVPSSARGVEFLAAILGPERIAGLPEQGFEYATLGDDEARWKALPRFSTYLAEPLLALDPELVLCDPWQSPETGARLREAGVRVVLAPETISWRDGARVLTELGALFGVEQRAAEAVADLERRVQALESGAGRRKGLRAVPYSNFGSQGFSAGSGTTIDEILRLAGLRNALAEAGRVGHGPMTFEELLVLDPDLIVVSTPLHTDVGHAGDRGGASRAVLTSEPSLAGLRAVREQRIVGLSPGLYACASQRVVDAAEALALEVDRWLAEQGR